MLPEWGDTGYKVGEKRRGMDSGTMIPPDGLIGRLQGEGVSTRYLQDRTGESRQECIKLLKSLGAIQDSMMWRLPSLRRTQEREKRLSANHVGTRRDGDLPWGAR